jgi:hypothetical protein
MRSSLERGTLEDDMARRSTNGTACPMCGGAGWLLVGLPLYDEYVCRSCGACYRVATAELPQGPVEICTLARGSRVWPCGPARAHASTHPPAHALRPTRSERPSSRVAKRAGARTPLSSKSAPRRGGRAPHAAPGSR